VTTTVELLSVRAAELYYEENKTQDEIGVLLGLTRWKVGRLLAQARELGIVRIEIVHPRARKLSMERELCERFSLVDAVVVPSAADGSSVADRVAEAAADYLRALRPPPATLGVSWGRTQWGCEPQSTSGNCCVNRRSDRPHRRRAGHAAAESGDP